MTVHKILTVVGARPQFVKLGALHRAIEHRDGVEHICVHTGQHYDHNMSRVFFSELGLPDPQYHLGIGGLSHGAMTGRMLERIEEVLVKERPDWVAVFGDTDSTLAGALAAVKFGVPVAHIEAGLRSYNRGMPEEINRVVADQCSTLLCTPTEVATQNLLREGVSLERICEVGDIMFDALLHAQRSVVSHSKIMEQLRLRAGRFILATIHRNYNTDSRDRLEGIVRGLSAIASQSIPVVFPLHPRTKAAMDRFGLTFTSHEVKVTDPIGYNDMIGLERNASLIVTDSGGVQKEAYFCKVPCITVRSETEWTELVDAGVNELCEPTVEAIKNAVEVMQERAFDWTSQFYGDGRAAEKIVDALFDHRLNAVMNSSNLVACVSRV